MLKRVDVLNFRGLRNVSVDLEPLTVLAGPNSSGKSSFLAALSPDQPKASDFWHHDWSTEVSLHLRGAGYNHAFSWRHPTPNTFVGNWGEKRPYAFQMLRLDVSAMREINQAQPTSQLSSNGGSLASLIGSFKSGQRADLAAEVCSLIPVFRNVDHQLAGHGTISIQFQDRWNDQVWYSPGEVSDGTMLVTAFLALRYQQPLPTLIAIEEPERGVHPYLLGEIIKVLRALTEGVGGPKVQVILATHSAELLDHVRPEEVRFFTKDAKDGAVRVSSISVEDPNWERAYDEYRQSLGDVWLSGGLGGVPGH